MPDALRRLFKLNTKAVKLVLLELDFWIPFLTMCLGVYFASASFAHEVAITCFLGCFLFSTTVNILFGKRQNQSTNRPIDPLTHRPTDPPTPRSHAALHVIGT